jgi:hypothetical protein
MTGAISPSIAAEAILIMAWQGFVFAAPFLAVAALWWAISRTDRIIDYLFPHLEWERSLGWLDIRSERRARAVLRWLGYAIYLLLGAALLGIPWATEGLVESLDQGFDPSVIGDVMLNAGVLMASLLAWVFFLGVWLIPKLRGEREERALRKFRVEMAEAEAEAERERTMHAPSRVHSPLKKPRTDAPDEAFLPGPAGRRRSHPGG